MYIGHINLADSFAGAGEHFVHLVESLKHHSVQQYVLVRNVELAKRLDLIDGVVVGPTIRSVVSAYCLMPAVDIVHVHDKSSSSAGLLFTLTRAVPFVMTRHLSLDASPGPISYAARNRAAGFIEKDDMDVESHLQVYRRAAESRHAPTVPQ